MPRIPDDLSDLDILKDADFMSSLMELQKMQKQIQPNLRAAANMRGLPTQSVAAQVDAYCALGLAAYAANSFLGSPFSEKGAAKTRNPPIANGLTHQIGELQRIVVTEYNPSDTLDFKKLPAILKRIRHLLRVFYDFKVSSDTTPDLKFCDFETVFDVAMPLHKVGLHIALDRQRLRAFMAMGGQEIEDLVLNDSLDIGKWRKSANKLEKTVREDEEADDADRNEVGEISDQANEDLAAHVAAWFYADINVGLLLNEPANAKEEEWASKSVDRLVKWSTSRIWRDVLGDPLTDSMRPIYWDKRAIVRLSHAGGLGAIYGDWVQSIASGLCANALQSLPDEAWEHQTKASLAAIARELEKRIEHESDQVVIEPIFVNTCYNIYKRYGLAPFQTAARQESWETSVLFYFITHRIKKDALEPTTKADWLSLLQEFVDLPYSISRRYMWSNLTVSGKWDCIAHYGCDYKACEEKAALQKLGDKRVRGVRDPAMEERLHRWGAKSKACGGCAKTSYCSTECQKAHWAKHKLDCKKSKGKGARAKNFAID